MSQRSKIDNFTPCVSLFGGALIGLSAVALMLMNGRVAGISGITAGLLSLSGSMRTARDKTLSMPRLILPSIQVNIRAGALPPAEENGVSYLKLPLNSL